MSEWTTKTGKIMEMQSSVTKDKKPKIDKSRLITKDWEPITDWGTTSQ